MKRSVFTSAVIALLVCTLAAFGCKSAGMAATTRGQLFKININAPESLPEGGSDNVDVVVSNRGVNNIQDVLVDVELPPQVVVLNQTNDRGIDVMHDPGSNVYHFSMSKLQPGEDSHIRFNVRTTFGPERDATITVNAWQKDLPSDHLLRKTTIKLRT